MSDTESTTPAPKSATPDPIAAVAAAEDAARAAHDAGTCADSEWSCSHCEDTAATRRCADRPWCVDEDHETGYHGSRLLELGDVELAPGHKPNWYCWLAEPTDGAKPPELLLEGEYADGRSAVDRLVVLPVRDVASLLTLFRDADVVAKLDGLLGQVDG